MKIYHERTVDFCTYIQTIYSDIGKVKIDFIISGSYIKIFFLFQL